MGPPEPSVSVASPGDQTPAIEAADQVREALARQDYLADHPLATAVLLAVRLQRPLLVEGRPGVGKTELAKALAGVFGAELIRLQCFEGIEASEALYEWDWRRQLLLARHTESASDPAAADLYRPEFLLERPLLKALRAGSQAVLLIDELDRADDQFDAFLLEALSDFSVSVPELGTIEAATRPLVVITSNRTRELHDALTRRCLYQWIDYPSVEREVEIIRLRAPQVEPELAEWIARAVAKLRRLDLLKPPGASEAVDWAEAVRVVGGNGAGGLADAALQTLSAVVKNRDDLRRISADPVPLLDG